MNKIYKILILSIAALSATFAQAEKVGVASPAEGFGQATLFASLAKAENSSADAKAKAASGGAKAVSDKSAPIEFVGAKSKNSPRGSSIKSASKSLSDGAVAQASTSAANAEMSASQAGAFIGFDWVDLLLKVLFSLAAIMIVMCFAGLSVVAERKVCAFIQGRYGPNRTAIPWVLAVPLVGRFLQRAGLMQLVADGLKFLLKEDPLPAHVNKFWYMLAPVMSLTPVLVAAAVIPFGVYWSDGVACPMSAANLDISLVFALAVGSLGVYGTIMAAWSSNSKFPYLGGMRASSQVISYELAMAVSVLPVVMVVAQSSASPLNLFEIARAQSGSLWFCLTQPLGALLFLIALFAETNRLPFDMAESETDLVSGFHTEYGSFKFGLFFVGEYGHMVVGSALFITLFLGAWNPLPCLQWPEEWGWISSVLALITFLVKIAAMLFFFIWIRWTLPRFRYDQVMNLGWKALLPLAIANFVFYLALISFGA